MTGISLAFVIVLLSSGCMTQTSVRSEPGRLQSATPADALVISNSGAYAVRFTIETADRTIPTNERFAMRVTAFARSGERWTPLTDAALHADAAMPHHGHGMNVMPTVTPQADGSFLVEGMLFHMPGRWELYFDITRNGLTERAQTEVYLE